MSEPYEAENPASAGPEGWDGAPPPDDGFDPDWTIAPGTTLRDWIAEAGETVEQAAEACGIPEQRFRGMLTGAERITSDDAARIAAGTGSSAAFWRRREWRYRDDLRRGKLDTTPQTPSGAAEHPESA